MATVREVVAKYSGKHKDPFYFAPNIPPGELQNALATYAQGCHDPEEVLFLFGVLDPPMQDG